MNENESNTKQLAWMAASATSGMLSAMLARKIVSALWGRATTDDPPVDPTDPNTTWGRALSWAVAAGIGAGVARVVGRRAADAAWRKVANEPPPLTA